MTILKNAADNAAKSERDFLIQMLNEHGNISAVSRAMKCHYYTALGWLVRLNINKGIDYNHQQKSRLGIAVGGRIPARTISLTEKGKAALKKARQSEISYVYPVPILGECS